MPTIYKHLHSANAVRQHAWVSYSAPCFTIYFQHEVAPISNIRPESQQRSGTWRGHSSSDKLLSRQSDESPEQAVERNREGTPEKSGLGGIGDNKEMMHVLESTLITWTKQIKNVLKKVRDDQCREEEEEDLFHLHQPCSGNLAAVVTKA